ncbi:hypothetical protein DRQ09_10440 [candidate division KSB1 bacterium]|nr:MAG: hypothetical protein DRQ09_10440 [candidate division KSB1 bacterium]
MEDEIITIIIASSTKEIRRFNLKQKTLKLLKITGVIFIVCFFLLIVLTIYLNKSNNLLKSKISALEQINLKMANIEKQKNEQLKNKKLIINATIDSIRTGKKDSLQEILSDDIGINNVSITKSDTNFKIQISFRLINKKMKKTISGYVIITGLPYLLNKNIYTTYPPFIQLDQNYAPLDYTEGESFSILKFKIISASLKIPASIKNIDFIVVTVYSRSGKILLRNILNIYDYIEN